MLLDCRSYFINTEGNRFLKKMLGTVITPPPPGGVGFFSKVPLPSEYNEKKEKEKT
jgi:hypothetical protein